MGDAVRDGLQSGLDLLEIYPCVLCRPGTGLAKTSAQCCHQYTTRVMVRKIAPTCARVKDSSRRSTIEVTQTGLDIVHIVVGDQVRIKPDNILLHIWIVKTYLLAQRIAVNIALYAVRELVLRALQVYQVMRQLKSRFHTPLASCFNEYPRPVNSLQKIPVRRTWFDAAVELRVRLKIRSAILRKVGLPSRIVREIIIRQRALFVVHNRNKVY